MKLTSAYTRGQILPDSFLGHLLLLQAQSSSCRLRSVFAEYVVLDYGPPFAHSHGYHCTVTTKFSNGVIVTLSPVRSKAFNVWPFTERGPRE